MKHDSCLSVGGSTQTARKTSTFPRSRCLRVWANDDTVMWQITEVRYLCMLQHVSCLETKLTAHSPIKPRMVPDWRKQTSKVAHLHTPPLTNCQRFPRNTVRLRWAHFLQYCRRVCHLACLFCGSRWFAVGGVVGGTNLYEPKPTQNGCHSLTLG